MANTTGKKFGGRKKGTPNKSTRALRERIEILLDDQWEFLISDLKKLDPKDRINTIIRLLEYTLPKLNRTEIRDVPIVEELMLMTSAERRDRIKELKIELNIDDRELS